MLRDQLAVAPGSSDRLHLRFQCQGMLTRGQVDIVGISRFIRQDLICPGGAGIGEGVAGHLRKGNRTVDENGLVGVELLFLILVMQTHIVETIGFYCEIIDDFIAGIGPGKGIELLEFRVIGSHGGRGGDLIDDLRRILDTVINGIDGDGFPGNGSHIAHAQILQIFCIAGGSRSGGLGIKLAQLQAVVGHVGHTHGVLTFLQGHHQRLHRGIGIIIKVCTPPDIYPVLGGRDLIAVAVHQKFRHRVLPVKRQFYGLQFLILLLSVDFQGQSIVQIAVSGGQVVQRQNVHTVFFHVNCIFRCFQIVQSHFGFIRPVGQGSGFSCARLRIQVHQIVGIFIAVRI